MEKQPPNSPDLIILDLGFVCSIQALQHEFVPSTVEELVAHTERAFNALEPSKLDDTFLSLQQVMLCIVESFGANTFKRPHMSKNKLRKQGCLPKNLYCSEMAFMTGQAYQFLVNCERNA